MEPTPPEPAPIIPPPTGLFVIAWTNHDNARHGRGTKQFTWAEATALASELNADFPVIHHEPVAVDK